ncbi:ketopantoate reductase family protein [Ilyobacter polytropus]|uniref:2-dehydropantoate 2-reductase n=1 Tax=Ilyobacter polytropus (strain ATCC 51220 / DSM 2926 / LMG 16218 / CuHBu1) TaxID=572544 RepID=E3H807_ILYPC|nr:2-dehydropantoate 2-reductase [Ilyobacter polytropus]ADO82959.1 ketopantoate reductase [Ilyobacter polytropus DSM 2926]
MNHSIKKVSIIGLGALGVMYAEHLSQKMKFEDLRIIADQKRIDRYKEEGIYCNGKKCHFNYVTPDEIVKPSDLLIFAVKYTHLQEAIEAVRHHVGEDTIILSVLNGIESERDIAKVYGEDHNLYCVAQGMTAAKVGNQMTYKHKGMLCFGELNENKNTEKVECLKRVFDKVEMPYEINNQMAVKLWSKLMINVGVNQTVAYFNTTNQTIQKEGPERDMMIAAMKEVQMVAQKEGIILEDREIDYWLNIMDGLNPAGMPSMAQDVKAKRYSEVELFAGTIVRLGKKHNVPVPVNTEFYRYFIELEAGY